MKRPFTKKSYFILTPISHSITVTLPTFTDLVLIKEKNSDQTSNGSKEYTSH